MQINKCSQLKQTELLVDAVPLLTFNLEATYFNRGIANIQALLALEKLTKLQTLSLNFSECESPKLGAAARSVGGSWGLKEAELAV